MRSPLQKVASLRVLLSEQEIEVGIEQIGSIEKRELLSIADLTSSRDIATTKLIKDHPLNSDVINLHFIVLWAIWKEWVKLKGLVRGVVSILQ